MPLHLGYLTRGLLAQGIHGLPLKSWDESDQKDGGYCTHGVPLFATWHRPYVLLYEVFYTLASKMSAAFRFDSLSPLFSNGCTRS
jgi:hypothetical protein